MCVCVYLRPLHKTVTTQPCASTQCFTYPPRTAHLVQRTDTVSTCSLEPLSPISSVCASLSRIQTFAYLCDEVCRHGRRALRALSCQVVVAERGLGHIEVVMERNARACMHTREAKHANNAQYMTVRQCPLASSWHHVHRRTGVAEEYANLQACGQTYVLPSAFRSYRLISGADAQLPYVMHLRHRGLYMSRTLKRAYRPATRRGSAGGSAGHAL